MTNRRFLFALALSSLTACATDASEPAATDDSPEVTGNYRLQTSLDMSKNPKVVEIEAKIEELAADPVIKVLQQMPQYIDNSLVRGDFVKYMSTIRTYASSKLSTFAPNFTTTMQQTAAAFADAATSFGLTHTLELGGADGTYTGTISTTGLHFTVDGVEVGLPFSESAGAADLVVRTPFTPGLRVEMQPSGELAIAEHAIPLPASTVLRTIMKKVVVPSIDATASGDFGLLVFRNFTCSQFAKHITYQLSLKNPYAYYDDLDFFEACVKATDDLANSIKSLVSPTDTSFFNIAISGAGTPVDADGDNDVDTIHNGTWTGTLTYSGTSLPLGGTFTGERL